MYQERDQFQPLQKLFACFLSSNLAEKNKEEMF
jgi:hypothetical protein